MTSPAPTVIIASMQTFEAGDQLAAALRKGGIRAELFRPPAHGRFAQAMRTASRAVYNTVHQSLDDQSPDGMFDLINRLNQPDVYALEATDETLEPLVRELAASKLPSLKKVCDATDPTGMVDKRWQAETAERVGLTVPTVWSDPEAVTTFPVLVKPLLGGGGEGIIRAESREELVEAWRKSTAGGDEVYIQQLVSGPTMHVGGVAHKGVPVVIAAYQGTTASGSPYGQITSSKLIHDDVAITAAESMLLASGFSGAFCFDLIVDDDGHHHFLEVNPRIFGSWMGLQLAGVDIVGAYIFAIGLGERPAASTLDYDTVWQLKHPSDANAREVARAGWKRAGTMKNTIGARGVSLMMVDLAAHLKRSKQ